MDARPLGVGVLVVATVTAGCVAPASGGDQLSLLWLSDTGRDVRGNHHAAVGATVEGEPMVFAPISGVPHRHDGGGHGGATAHASAGCALVALNGTTGAVRWTNPVPPANCTIHSVADPTVADVVGDGTPEVVAATTERRVAAFDALNGTVLFSHPLSLYGYTRPVVADLTGDAREELVVVDIQGTVFVTRPGGATLWRHELDGFVWGQPHVVDVDGDGAREVVVGLGSGQVVALAADGTVEWTTTAARGAVTWSAVARIDGAPAVVVGTADGHVVALDGTDGSRTWSRDLGTLAAVHAVGDGDGDGAVEVYATAADGVVRALSAADGGVEWTTNVTDGPVQMMPPPSMGDLDGDGAPELVVASNGGTVSVLSPANGSVLATYARDVRVYARPTLADLDGDDGLEVLLMYGDGRVAALDYSP